MVGFSRIFLCIVFTCANYKASPATLTSKSLWIWSIKRLTTRYDIATDVQGNFSNTPQKKHHLVDGFFPILSNEKPEESLPCIQTFLHQAHPKHWVKPTNVNSPIHLFFNCQVSIQDLLDIQLPRPYCVEMPKAPRGSAISRWHAQRWRNEWGGTFSRQVSSWSNIRVFSIQPFLQQSWQRWRTGRQKMSSVSNRPLSTSMLSCEKRFHDLVFLKTGFMLTIHKNSEKTHVFFLWGQVAWYKNRWKRMLWTTCWVKVSWDQGSKHGRYISKLRTLSLASETNTLSTKKLHAINISINC